VKTQLASAKKNVFLTTDIQIQDWDFQDCERYIYPRANLEKSDYTGCENMSDEEFNDWRDENLSYQENYVFPMMNALRYFPSFCSFDESDAQKCSGSTCLIYDRYLEQWAVGMSGGGMDLSPHLLDTFINLESGIPLELANSIRRSYNAYVSLEIHEENCNLLADAFRREAHRNISRAQELDFKLNSQ